jgi:hypothetical protein
MFQLKEESLGTDREVVMARLSRKIGRGRDAIYHGTRHLPIVMRAGKLHPPSSDNAVFFTRSPEIAAYWASFMGYEADQFSGGVLVLDRASLARSYRLELTRYAEDWTDEREESIWGRVVNFRRHLIGVVRAADVDAILGPSKHRYYPSDFYKWSEERSNAFNREIYTPSEPFTREGRIKVRQLIVQQRKQFASPSLSASPSHQGEKVRSSS